MKIKMGVQPVSMVDREDRQVISVSCVCDHAIHGFLAAVSRKTGNEICRAPIAFQAGKSENHVLFPVRKRELRVVWRLLDADGLPVAEKSGVWSAPREWKIHVMISSHTDIGLHNSQYIQRYNSERFLDQAMELCDRTAGRAPEDRYRYVMEGTWFWNNYPADRGEEAAKRVVEEYILPGKIGLCAGIAGNHTQVFGLEEMCRSTYGRKAISEKWGVDSRTMTMIDNNGLSWAMVQPYAEAGYENVIFAPNQWNPRPSTVWDTDTGVLGYTWNPEAGGGGSMIDFRFGSALPQVFFWEDREKKHRLLVFGGGNYGAGMHVFGLYHKNGPGTATLQAMECSMKNNLPVIEKKVPYDMWIGACYNDDQEPDLLLTDAIAMWNGKWRWPQFQTVGDPDIFFDAFRRRFADRIPVIHGEITGGWYQHPLSTPELLAQKMEADRRLADAEKLSVIASLLCENHAYPADAFQRAWDQLLWNDEHSYGTSGYQGRRVYETWLQHRRWIGNAEQTAAEETERAVRSLSEVIAIPEDALLLLNTMGRERTESVLWNGKITPETTVPGLGYAVVPISDLRPYRCEETVSEMPPVIENEYYRIIFSENGSMASIYDKQLQKEWIEDGKTANTLIYTRDNHASFTVARKASFLLRRDAIGTTVVSRIEDRIAGAEVVQSVRLTNGKRRIEIDNQLRHVSDFFNNCRYDRYLYYAFPFALDNAHRYCHLNGTVAEYGVDLTGHTTDVYMSVREWCCAENGSVGVGLIQLDGGLVEFDHIHPDKTDFGAPGGSAAMYIYLANDWLQMHGAGGRHINFRFRYCITSYKNGWASAGLDGIAEQCASPLIIREARWHPGRLRQKSVGFAEMHGKQRLAGLKYADDANGLIARLYSPEPYAPNAGFALNESLFGKAESRPNTVDEREMNEMDLAESGFRTLRLTSPAWKLPLRKEPATSADDLHIGTVYTGLMDRPGAIRGEKDGHLYLLWGKCMSDRLAGYELCRGETEDFTADESSRIAFIEPGPYRVERYEDLGLETDKAYYYRVRAQRDDGECGEWSDVFGAYTKEPVRDT